MATQLVYNGQNGLIGRFCASCATKKVAELNKLETSPAPLSRPEGDGA